MPYYQELRELHSRIAKNIFYLRKQHNLTQQELAEKIGVTRSMVNMLESGRRTLRLRTLIGISVGLGVSLESLLAADISNHPRELLQKIYGVPSAWYSLPTRIKEGGLRWHDAEHSGLEVEVEGIPGYCNQIMLDTPAYADFLASFADLGVTRPEEFEYKSVMAYYHFTSLQGFHRRR